MGAFGCVDRGHTKSNGLGECRWKGSVGWGKGLGLGCDKLEYCGLAKCSGLRWSVVRKGEMSLLLQVLFWVAMCGTVTSTIYCLMVVMAAVRFGCLSPARVGTC